MSNYTKISDPIHRNISEFEAMVIYSINVIICTVVAWTYINRWLDIAFNKSAAPSKLDKHFQISWTIQWAKVLFLGYEPLIFQPLVTAELETNIYTTKTSLFLLYLQSERLFSQFSCNLFTNQLIENRNLLHQNRLWQVKTVRCDVFVDTILTFHHKHSAFDTSARWEYNEAANFIISQFHTKFFFLVRLH